MVATLVTTILGTFSTSLALHDKVQEKRFQSKQKKLDASQDDKINDLERKVKRIQNGDDNGGRSRSTSRNRRPKPRRRSTGDDGDSDDFDRQARRSRAVIAREFQDNVDRLGAKYAQGDIISENRLQAQVIALQQTVIDVLQDALMSGRSLTKADVRRLIAAQNRARDGSLEALHDQYNRMIQTSGRRPSAMLENQPVFPPTRQLTAPAIASPTDDSFPPARRSRTLPANADSASPPQGLYCRYAYDLQNNYRKGVSSAFAPSGSQRCPACDLRLPVTGDKVWVVESGEGSWTIDPRLVLKSHTAQGDYVCVLCYNDRGRDADCFCSSVDALIKHTGRMHTREEFDREIDIFQS